MPSRKALIGAILTLVLLLLGAVVAGVFDKSASAGVILASFTATGGDGQVLIEWETANEMNVIGFNLWRSTTRTGSYTMLDFIPSQAPGSLIGAYYSYTDTDVVNGITYYYKLEVVATDGSIIESAGPISATPGVETTPTATGTPTSTPTGTLGPTPTHTPTPTSTPTEEAAPTPTSTVPPPPSLGSRIQLPRIDLGDAFGSGTSWSTRIQIQNVGSKPTWAAVIYWRGAGRGALGTWHKRWLPLHGVWTLTPPAGAQSAMVLSFASEPTGRPNERTVADGERLAVTVDRWGLDPYGTGLRLSSSYVGISEPAEEPAPSSGRKYFVPYVMHRYNDALDTIITIQNSGDKRTSIWVYYKEEGNCEYQVAQHIGPLSPGEAIRVGPPGAVGVDEAFPVSPGWLGSAYISSNVPLGIIVDQLSFPPSLINRGTMLTCRGIPSKKLAEELEWDTAWYADLLYQQISGWSSSIQVQNLTQASKPTFVTVNFMDQSGDEVLFVGDWVCRNGSITFYLPAIVDMGVNFPFGFVGAAEIESHEQVDYPGGEHDGEPIFAVVDIKKTEVWDPSLGTWRHAIAGETQGGAYNAHPRSETVNATSWAMPFIVKEQEGGVVSRIVIRNNSNCNKFEGQIRFRDETGNLVGTIHVPWLGPKHMKVFDMAYQGWLPLGFIGAATFEVLGVEQLCDTDDDGQVDQEPVMSSVAVLNYGWAVELQTTTPFTATGDLCSIYEGIPFGVAP